jgi:hypothetical protein
MARIGRPGARAGTNRGLPVLEMARMTARLDSRALFCTSLVAAMLCLPALVHAEDAKPAISIKTKAIEASVSIDDKLKAYPGLADNLLAEGRREVEKWRASADKDRKDAPDDFADGRRYSFERSYTQRSAIGRYVSVERGDYLNAFGAHPNSETNTILWDANAKKRVSIRRFFKETATGGPTLNRLAKAVRAKLAVEKKARGGDEVDPETDTELANVQPDLLKMGAVALVPSAESDKSAGLVFYFSPYAVGSYAEGPYSAFVSWQTFKDDLSPEGAALFGGERPKADEEKD